MAATKTVQRIKEELRKRHEVDSSFPQSIRDQACLVLDSLNVVVGGIGKKLSGLKIDWDSTTIEFSVDEKKFAYKLFGGIVEEA